MIFLSNSVNLLEALWYYHVLILMTTAKRYDRRQSSFSTMRSETNVLTWQKSFHVLKSIVSFLYTSSTGTVLLSTKSPNSSTFAEFILPYEWTNQMKDNSVWVATTWYRNQLLNCMLYLHDICLSPLGCRYPVECPGSNVKGHEYVTFALWYSEKGEIHTNKLI